MSTSSSSSSIDSSSSSSIDSSSSSSSSITMVESSSTSTGDFAIYGTTYYSDCKDENSITNPVIDNDVRMQFSGFWEKNWAYNTRETNVYGIRKTPNSLSSIFCNDASRLFSMSCGYVGMVLNFPFNIVNGTSQKLLNDQTIIKQSILWGIDVSEYNIFQPGILAEFTEKGLEFTIWTSESFFTMIDSTSFVNANTDIFYEFAWDLNGIEGTSATFLLKRDNSIIASGNPPILNDSIANLNFYALNSLSTYSNRECTLRKLVIYNIIPEDLI